MNAHFSRALDVGTQLVFPQMHEHVGFQFGQDHLLFEGMGHVSTRLLLKTFFLNHKKRIEELVIYVFFFLKRESIQLEF